MALARISHRLFLPSTLNHIARSFFHRHHYRKYLPEAYFTPVTNVFQRWEKEFERMQGQLNHFFQDLKANRSILDSAPNENDLIITEPDGSRKFHLSLNTHGFGPEDIKIKTQNGTLSISAKKEKKVMNSYSLHEFSQTYSLPEELNIDDLKSTYTENGILSIEASLPKVKPKHRQIQIERIK